MYNSRMELYRLSATITVSSQLVVKDLDEIKKNGVDILVCNRPDNESPEQPRFENIATAAKHMGITPINISFKPDNQTEQDVIAFEKILNSNKKVHAFCRTGNRSITLWAAASVRTGSCPNQILKITKTYGINPLNAIMPYLKNSSS